MSSTVVTVKVINFRHGVRHVKRMGGTYDPAAKTWLIPADRPELGNLAAYGLELVNVSAQDVGSDHITDDRLIEAMDDEHSML
jgi:hypothetical protein